MEERLPYVVYTLGTWVKAEVLPHPEALEETEMESPLLVDSTSGAVRCNFCGKSFTAIRNAKRHLKEIHMGKNQFACHLCPRAFVRRERLKVHLRSDHSEYLQ